LLDAIAQDPGFAVGKGVQVTLTGNTPISANGGVLLGIDDQLVGAVLDATTLEPRPTRPLRPSPSVVVDTGSRLLGVIIGSSLETVDLETGEIVGRLPSVTARSWQVGISHDGTTLAIANDTDASGTQAGVSLYDVATGRRLVSMSVGDGAAVRDVAFSPDGRHVMAVVDESRPVVWEIVTGNQLVVESPEKAAITRLAMSPSGNQIALGRDDGLVEMWTLDDRAQWQPLDIRSLHHGSISWIDFDQDGGRMISTSRDGVAVVWDTITGKLATRPRTFTERELSMSFFRPGSASSLVSIDTDGRTWDWDLQRDVSLVTTVSGANLGATVSASPGTSVLVPSPGGVVAYSPSGGAAHEVPFNSGDTPKRSIVASADGTRIVVAYVDGRLELRDALSGNLIIAIVRNVHSLEYDESLLPRGELMIALDRSGARVAFVGSDERIQVVDDDGTLVDDISLSSQRQNVQAIDLSDDGSGLVISTQAGEAIWYDLEGIDASTIAPKGTGFDAHFLSDYRVAVVGAGGAQIIDPRSRRTTTRFNFGTDLRRFAVDSTGRLLATVDGSGAVQIWDAHVGARIGDALHIRNVSSSVPIQFSADGHYLLVSGLNETTWVDVWTADWLRVGCSLVTDRLSSVDLGRYLGSSGEAESCP
jgi:WD40 repeat protein